MITAMSSTVLPYSVQIVRPRWRRRTFVAITLIGLAGLAWFGRHVPARLVMLHRQSQCLAYSRPPGPTRTYFASDVPSTIAGDPDFHLGHRPDKGYFWYYYPKCLKDFEESLPGLSQNLSAHTPVYVGERVSPCGNRRMVIARCMGRIFEYDVIGTAFVAAVFKPATFSHDVAFLNSNAQFPLNGIGGSYVNPRRLLTIDSDSGVSDPDDSSRFTIKYRSEGATRVLEGRLTDDDRIVWTVR